MPSSTASKRGEWVRVVVADEQPVATVVVPARNCAATIGRTIALVDGQITASGRHCEIVVVDDASTDATHAAAQSAAEACVNPVVCVRRETRGGPNASRNTGVRASRAPALVFLDGDDEPMTGWLVAMLDAVSGDDVIAGGAYRIERPGSGARDGRPGAGAVVPLPVRARRRDGDDPSAGRPGRRIRREHQARRHRGRVLHPGPGSARGPHRALSPGRASRIAIR